MLHQPFYISSSNFLLLVLFFFSIVILYLGSLSLLKGSVLFAKLLHIRQYIIGLTVVALATSMPEFFVSINAAFSRLTYIPVANVIGSNLFNSLLIYGIYLLFSSQISSISIKNILLVSILNSIIYITTIKSINTIPWWIGVFFLLGLLLYFYHLLIANKGSHNKVWHSNTENSDNNKLPHTPRTHTVEKEEQHISTKHLFSRNNIIQVCIATVGVIGGTVLLYVASEIFLSSIIELAKRFGISEKIVGLLIVSLGTSIPELFIILAAIIPLVIMYFRKNKKSGTTNFSDIGEGNILGSNIINILLIIGSTALISPIDNMHHFSSESILLLISNAALLLLMIKKVYIQKIIALVFISTFILYVYILYHQI